MRIVLQRVASATVEINGKIHAGISNGLLLLLGIENDDTLEDIDWLCRKITAMRIFPDAEGKMNLSVCDTNGHVLVISQFTLHASTKKGNRPSFIRAAKPDVAIPLYEEFLSRISSMMSSEVKSGIFGADMKVGLVNDGPVTIVIDTKMKE
jgi:D-tyrosyl-tRNA(Tyr) deacylase